MNRERPLGVWLRLLALTLAVAPLSYSQGAEVPLARTNWTERWITNLIEVQMPENVFVDKFHTNYHRKYYTNVVELYQTNWLTENVTNTIPVDATRKVRVTEYKTNWNVMRATNEIPVAALRTNFVDHWRTNFVDQYRTNWKTLSLTNWQTVLVMKTNWTVQPLTNVVEIDMAANKPSPAPAVEPPAQVAPAPTPVEHAPARSAGSTGEIGFDIATARTGGNNLEVRLTARWNASDSAAPPRVQQWHVESENGAILCSSQEQEFKRELPAGRYRVEVRGRRESDGATLSARGTLSVTAGDAVMLPRIARK